MSEDTRPPDPVQRQLDRIAVAIALVLTSQGNVRFDSNIVLEVHGMGYGLQLPPLCRN